MAAVDDLAARAMEPVPDGDRRVKAVRALLGLATPADLSAFLAERGVRLSKDVIEEIEWPSRPRALRIYEAAQIAGAAEIPVSFFLAPLERLGDVDT